MIVELWALTTEQGGRLAPVLSGYRPNWDNGDRQPNGDLHLHDGAIDLIDVDVLLPGGNAQATLTPAVPEFWGHVQVGDLLAFQEGSRVIGFARVIES